jgi:hypothetical protein
LKPFLENIRQQNACLIRKTTILKNVAMSSSISTCKQFQSTPLLVPPLYLVNISLIHVQSTLLVLLKEHKENCIYELN